MQHYAIVLISAGFLTAASAAYLAHAQEIKPPTGVSPSEERGGMMTRDRPSVEATKPSSTLPAVPGDRSVDGGRSAPADTNEGGGPAPGWEPVEARLAAIVGQLKVVEAGLARPDAGPTDPAVVTRLDDLRRDIGDLRTLATPPPSAPPDFVKIQEALEDIREQTDSSLFTTLLEDYLGNLVWEFLGIGRGGGATTVNWLGRIASLASLLLSIWGLYDKFRKWKAVPGPAGVDPAAKPRNSSLGLVWAFYVLLLTGAFVVIAWSRPVSGLSASAATISKSLDGIEREAERASLQSVAVELSKAGAKLEGIEKQLGGLEKAKPAAPGDPAPVPAPVVPAVGRDIAALRDRLAAIDRRLNGIAGPLAGGNLAAIEKGVDTNGEKLNVIEDAVTWDFSDYFGWLLGWIVRFGILVLAVPAGVLLYKRAGGRFQ